MAVFVTILEAGSLSGAARRLDMPLATVSRKLSELEGHLGTRLLQRSSRRLALTDSGRDYLVSARSILEHVEEAERAAVGAYLQARGELVVAAPRVFGRLHVASVVASYLELQPAVDIRLQLGDRWVNLQEEHVDIALRIGALPDSALVAIAVGAIRRVTCASPRYLAGRGLPRSPADLAAHCCVSFDGLVSATAWVFSGERGPVRVPVRSRLVVNSADAAIAAVEAGLGITQVLSYQVARAIAEGRLVRVLESYDGAPIPVNLVYPERGRLPMKSRTFLDFAQRALRERLSGSPVPPR